jgi:hypothetical protein
VSTLGWIFFALGAGIVIAVIDVSRWIDRTNKLLERICDELIFANKDKREDEKRERYPNLPLRLS